MPRLIAHHVFRLVQFRSQQRAEIIIKFSTYDAATMQGW